MNTKKSLKYVMAALTILITNTKLLGCPTCVGRLNLGVKEPFFKQYKPRPIDRRKYKAKHKYEFASTDFWIRLKKQMVRQEKFLKKD